MEQARTVSLAQGSHPTLGAAHCRSPAARALHTAGRRQLERRGASSTIAAAMEHPPETSAGDDDPQPSLSAASAIVPLRSVDGPASPPFVAHSSPPAPATEFSQRAPAPKKRGELEAGVPDSWRSRDRESRRTCRGECGECGAYVFTGAVDPGPTRTPLPPVQVMHTLSHANLDALS